MKFTSAEILKGFKLFSEVADDCCFDVNFIAMIDRLLEDDTEAVDIHNKSALLFIADKGIKLSCPFEEMELNKEYTATYKDDVCEFLYDGWLDTGIDSLMSAYDRVYYILKAYEELKGITEFDFDI